MAWYNTSDFVNQSGFFDILKVANEYTNNLFGTLFLLGFFVMLMIITSKPQYEVKHRLAVSAFSTAVVGIIYVPLGLVNTWFIYLMIFLFVVGFIGLFTGD